MAEKKEVVSADLADKEDELDKLLSEVREETDAVMQ
jgi:hypothetical protein